MTLRLLALAVVVGGLVGGAGAASTSAASPQFGPLIEFWDGSSWTQQASPNPEGSAEFNAVVAISTTDAWALGAYGRLLLPYGGGRALAVHWDGSSWEQVAIPTPKQATEVRLYGAAATSSNDVWAVGAWAGGPGSSYHTLIEHWDGNSWTIVPSHKATAQLFGVAALSPTDAWAVGYFQGAALFMHWDGKAWKKVTILSNGRNASLAGITAVSPRGMWAVGTYNLRVNSPRQTLVMHWNGRTWMRVNSPTPGMSGALSAVAAAGRNNIWAVGSYRSGHGPRLLAERWNGRSWKVVPVRRGTNAEGLTSLAVAARDDIWAAGTYDIGRERTLSTHWDGSAWSLMPSPNPVTGECNHFSAIGAAAPAAVWAVGSFYLGG